MLSDTYKLRWRNINVQSKDIVAKVTNDFSPTYKEFYVDSRDKVATHDLTNKGEELLVKVTRAGAAVNDIVGSAIHSAMHLAKSKGREFFDSEILEHGSAARKDSAEIGLLGHLVTVPVRKFENMENIICEHSYQEQVQLLAGYKVLLEEQIRVIDARRHFGRRL